jgi:hypothetical protein
MLSCRVESPRFTSAPAAMRIHWSAFFGIVLYFALTIGAADRISQFPRFCPTCRFHGVESFANQGGQFVVHGSTIPFRAPAPLTNNPAIVELEPQLIVVTAERTKRVLCQTLRATDDFQDKIHISVLDRAPETQPVTIVSQVHPDGFVYKGGFPARIEAIKFAKGLMQVILLEYANRGARRCAELPLWLVEGMTREVMTAVQPAYVLNRRPLTIETVGYDRLGATRPFLHTNSPLSIQELSFPRLAGASDEARTRFGASAHLLVHRLLALPNGPALMAQFLRTLPQTLNWQTALFSVYKEHFDGPLSFEKWWMLNWVEFRKRQAPEYWPLARALDRLDALLLTSVEVRSATNNIPSQRLVTVQELLQSTDFAAQRELLGQKVQQMFFMTVNVPTGLLPLWAAYQNALESYLQKRSLLDYQPGLKSDPEQRVQALIKSTLTDLDQLDFARSELKAGRTLVLPKNLSIQARR